MNKTLRDMLLMMALFIAVHTNALVVAADNTKYRPYKHDYPQIIQAHDYETIQFIEALFIAVSKLGNESADCALVGKNLIFTSKDEPEKKLTIRKPDSKTVIIGNKRFVNKNSAILYSTMKGIMADLTKEGECILAKFSQFPTTAYKKRTIIEFNFGPRVLVVDSFSNGPKDDERLYILDLVDSKESYFWGKIE